MLYQSVIAFIFIIIFDMIWLSFRKTSYNSLVNSIQKTDLSIRKSGAFIAYILMFLSTFYIFDSIKKEEKIKSNILLSLKYSASLGFLIYGIFNATNYAMFNNYNINIGILDTLWGTFVYFISIFLTLLIFGK